MSGCVTVQCSLAPTGGEKLEQVVNRWEESVLMFAAHS